MAIEKINGDESGIELAQKINEMITTNNIITLTGAVTGEGSINMETGEVEIDTTDNSTKALTLLKQIYPIGSIFIGTTLSCPIASLFGTWTKITGGLTLQQADSTYPVGTEIPAGLPNITGAFRLQGTEGSSAVSGAFSAGAKGGSWGEGHNNSAKNPLMSFNASKSNSIYGANDTVQPPALAVNIWQRTA